jgi:hypothetical protein
MNRLPKIYINITCFDGKYTALVVLPNGVETASGNSPEEAIGNLIFKPSVPSKYEYVMKVKS